MERRFSFRKRVYTSLLVCMILFCSVPANYATVVTTAVAQQTSNELIPDGSFEKFSVGTILPTSENANNVPYTYASQGKVTDEMATDGSKSLLVTPTGTSQPSLNQKVSLERGKTYFLSADVYRGAAIPGTNPANSVSIRFDCMNWNDRGMISGNDINGKFGKVYTIYTADKDYSSVRAILLLYNGYYQYIDNFSCVEIPAEGPQIAYVDFANKIKDENGVAVVPRNVQFSIIFDGIIDEQTVDLSKLSLNGRKLDEINSTVTVSDGKINVSIRSLIYKNNYNFVLGEGTCKDIYGRASKEQTVKFRTEDAPNDMSEEAYYFIDDDFALLSSNETVYWGWDVVQNAGSISYGSSLNLNDTSNSQSTVVKRSFEDIKSSRTKIEFRMSMGDLSNGVGFSLYNDDSEVLKLAANSGAVYANSAFVYTALSANVGIRIEANLYEQKCDIYVNGKRRAKDVELKGNSINNIRFHTSKEGTGTLVISSVRGMKGYYVADEMVAQSNEAAVENGIWEVNNEAGNISTVRLVNSPSSEYLSLKISDTSEKYSSSIGRTFNSIDTTAVTAFKIYSNNSINNFNINAGSFNARILSGKLMVLTGNEYVAVATLSDNLWNTIRFTCNYAEGRAIVQVNGKEVGNGISFTPGSVNELRFATGLSEKDEIILDDIYLYELLDDSENYPAEPNKFQKTESDIIVGIQTCDLWREGKHFGWDKINASPYRKPYLGFYDDGNPEAMDWQIKYMVEHGIDYMINMWYRPGNAGLPIKEPRNGYALHDGYFNAKYKNKLKFAISWENSNYTAATYEEALNDFKNNIVPFWIGYYFKDPNYLSIDNKAVVGLYSLSSLIDIFGEQGAKDALSYLEGQAKTLGFDGIYLLGTTSTTDAEKLIRYSSYGFDAIYSYSYGQKNVTKFKQMRAIKGQKSNDSIIPYIPTITMGRDDTPWDRTAGGFITPEALESLCEWVKDTYFKNNTEKTHLGDRMICLDNWNEYGEGHFFMPSALYGFEYLEAVGKVFGMPEHTDVRPENTERLGHLYDQNRKVPVKESARIPRVYGNDYTTLKQYTFDTGREGFTFIGNYSSSGSQGGALRGVTQNNETDPRITSPDNLGIELTGREFVHIRYKYENGGASTKMYYSFNDDTSFTESKSIVVSCFDANGEYQDLYFELLGEGFNGKTLKRLRFDPFETTGTFYYDLIEILRYDKIDIFESQKCFVSFKGFYDKNGDLVEHISDGITNITAKYYIYNPNDNEEMWPFVAEYEGNMFVKLYPYSDSVMRTGFNSVNIPVDCTKGRKYSAMIWSEEMVPLLAKETLE